MPACQFAASSGSGCRILPCRVLRRRVERQGRRALADLDNRRNELLEEARDRQQGRPEVCRGHGTVVGENWNRRLAQNQALTMNEVDDQALDVRAIVILIRHCT